MVNNQEFYTITEAEIIYYTPGKSDIQSHRLYSQWGID